MKNILIILFILQLGCSESENKNYNKNEKYELNENEKYELNYRNKKKEIIFNFHKIDNEIKRTIREVKFTSLFHMGGITDTIFKMPIGVRTDKNHNIYVLDEIDKSVKKFDKTGNFIAQYGRLGRGPGEFLFLQGFDVSDDGKIAMADPNNNKITVFENENVSEFKCRFGPMKVNIISPNELVIHQMLEPIFSSSIRKIDYVKKEVTDFQNILNKNSFGNDIYGVLPFLIGDLISYKKNYTVFTSKVLNFAVVYNNKGEFIKEFKFIADDLNLSQVSIEKFSNKMTYVLTSIDDDKLFVCKNIQKKGKGSIVVDIFTISKGKYLYSISLDFIEDLWAVQFSDNKMFAIKQNTEIEIFLVNL